MGAGRPVGTKKYTADRLRKAVKAYFNGISYWQPATRPELALDDNGYPVLDKYGHEIYNQVPVKTIDGKQAQILCWIEPPTIMGLCLKLRINKSTFARYAEDEELGEIVEYARARIEAYLSGRLENKDAVRGASFTLQHNFGWNDKAVDDGPKEIHVRFGGQDNGDPFA